VQYLICYVITLQFDLRVKQPKVGPAGWLEQLENIRSMRSKRDAPVDTMGCERVHDPNAPEPVRRFQILVGLMLSSQVRVLFHQ
jgi:endonuclease-3